MRCASTTSCPSAAVPGHNPGGGKTCIARYNPRDASAATANSQRGPNRNGRTMNPASAYSVRMSPFQIRQRWMSPNASNTTSRRTSSNVRRSLLASRSNWMARPAPNSSENSANAFKSTASIRMVSTALSIGDKDQGGLGKRNRSKIETRNIGHDVHRDDAEQGQAPQHVDGVDPLCGAYRPGRCGAIGHCNLIPVERRMNSARRSTTAAYPVAAGPRS